MKNQTLKKGKPKVVFPIILLTSLILFTTNINAQEGPGEPVQRKSTLGISLGHHSIKQQDLLISPMLYKGGSASAFNLNYQVVGAKSLFRVHLNYESVDIDRRGSLSFGLNGATISRKSSEFTGIGVGITYAKQLKSKNFKLYLGAALTSKLDWTVYNLGLADEDIYLIATSVSPYVNVGYTLKNGDRIDLESQIPMASLVSRNKFAIVDNEEIQHEGSELWFAYQQSEFKSFSDYQAIDIRVTWSRSLSSSLDLTVGYLFSYSRYEEPQKFSIRKNNIDIGLAIKL